jgi:two-component system sensor histidine kinase/response regulator
VSLKNIPLKVKLTGAFFLMAAISASIGIIGNIHLRSIRQADLDLYQNDTKPQPDLAGMSATFQKIRVALRDFLASPSPDQKMLFLTQAIDLERELDRSIESYRATNFSPEERRIFGQLVQVRKAYRHFERLILEAGESGRPQDGWAILWSDSYGQVAKTMLGSLASIEEVKVAHARKASEANIALANADSFEMLVIIAIGVILAFGTAVWLTISITRPVRQMMQALRAVAEGDLTQRVEIGSNDEIGQMAKTLNWTITELKTARMQLIDARETAVAASQAKSEFLSSMSHEIRTPMNAVLGMCELLSETDLGSEQRRYLEVMSSNGASLLDLINSILDLAKIESGRLQIERTEFDFTDLIERTLATFAATAHGKGLELAARIAPGVPDHLVGDPLRLRQILVNLLGNAIKFTELGEVVLLVENNPEDNEPGSLKFTVSDTGIGIPADKLESIFSTFTQVDSSTTRKYGGTGLGLAIVHRLVKLMGGRIWAESLPGEGSRFIFTATFELASRTITAIHQGLPDLAGMRVLVVDDSSINREIAREMVISVGATVSEAESGSKALAEIYQAIEFGDPFKLILLDMRMPEMDGLEVATRIRREIKRHAPLILMLSSDDLTPQLSRLREAHLNAYLVKPITRRELFQAIGKVLAEDKSDRVVKAAEPSPLAPPPVDLPPARILVAEDSPDNCLLITAYLKRTPCRVDFAENGRVAVEKFTRNHYDLVLMDLQMPVMDGCAATRAIRAWELQHGVPRTNVLALTASVLEEAVIETRKAGCDAHLTKPVKKSTLLNAIRQYARHSAPQTGATEADAGSARNGTAHAIA